MSIKDQIKSLLQEAEIYRTQGLLNEAMSTYKKAVEIIKNNIKPESSQQLLEGINNKITSLKQDISKFTDAKIPELSVDTQDLIKQKFAFSNDNESSILEGAIILTKFGQFERAVKEFNELLKVDSLRLVAAKNILRCHVASSGADNAVSQYKEWLKLKIFSAGQEEKIKFFLENLLEEKGIDKNLLAQKVKKNTDSQNIINEKAIEETKPSIQPLMDIPTTDDNDDNDEFLDINSVGITLDTDMGNDSEILLDVAFQSDDMISLIVPGREKALIEKCKIGLKFNNIQFYSPIAILNGSGVILAFSKIDSGPKMGNYSLDIKMFTD